jgi:hypothetical protein
MAVDPEFLRQQYASLSDEALEDIDREGLVPAAQKVYDDELRLRNAQAEPEPRRSPAAAPKPHAGREQTADGEEPEWLEEAAEVYSVSEFQSGTSSQDAVNARDVLEAAGIPCYLDRAEIPEEQSVTPPSTRWSLLVPGDLNLEATSVLDRDIFNTDFEANWKSHLEHLSDEELEAMDPQAALCGIFDRVERVLNTFEAELERRGLK